MLTRDIESRPRAAQAADAGAPQLGAQGRDRGGHGSLARGARTWVAGHGGRPVLPAPCPPLFSPGSRSTLRARETPHRMDSVQDDPQGGGRSWH